MLTETIVRLGEALSARVSTRALPEPPVPVVLPKTEDPRLDDFDELGEAEGQSFIIEYENAAGERSRRPITVWAIKYGAVDVPLLVARCHVRKRTVTFRVDRITACIDFNGEVFEDVPVFLAETFGMSVAAASRSASKDDLEDWDAFLAFHRAPLTLLSALSHADREAIPDETGVIVRYCLDCAHVNLGTVPSDAFGRIAASYIRRLRPTRAAIDRALERMLSADLTIEEANRFMTASSELVDIDGRRHPAEIALINELGRELFGLDLM